MADPMSRETMFELAGLLSQLPPDQVDQLVAEMRREQPEVHAFLRAVRRLFPDDREYVKVFGTALGIWQIMKHSVDPPGLVTAEMLRRAQDSYAAEIKRLATAKGEERMRAISEMVFRHPEPAVLGYMVLSLREKDPPLSDDSHVLANNVLRIVLDALIASRSPEGGLPPGMVPVGRA